MVPVSAAHWNASSASRESAGPAGQAGSCGRVGQPESRRRRRALRLEQHGVAPVQVPSASTIAAYVTCTAFDMLEAKVPTGRSAEGTSFGALLAAAS